MSEKRFTLVDWNEYAEGEEIYYENGEEMGSLDVVDRLNELYEENSSLKIDDEFKKKSYSKLLDSFIDLKKKYQTLKKEKQMLKIVDDYLLEYDGDYFDMHKPSDIRSLVYLFNRINGFSELQCEYNDEEMI